MPQYFLEIKNRLILVFIHWFSILFIVYIYKETILFMVVEPNIIWDFKKSLETFYFIFTSVTEIFSVYLKLAVFFSLQFLYMYLIYHFFVYFSPAFFYIEYLYFKFMLEFIFLSWVVFNGVSTYFIIPFIWNFFLSFQNLATAHSFILHFELKLNDYILFYISFYYICIFYFQFFFIFFIFLDYIKYNLKIIKKFRKIYYFCFIIFSTAITPPDFLSQILTSLVSIWIYEFLIVFVLLKTEL